MSTLLRIEGTLTPADAKTVKSFAFDVPAGTEAMALVVEWTPHFSDDVARNTAHLEVALAEWGGPKGDGVWNHPDVARCKARLPNLLNAVLVEPSGRWRGRSDRGKATRDVPLVVDPVDPGPGFMPGALQPGRWTLDLEVHSVVVDECRFFLEITTRPAAQQSARPLAPDVGAVDARLRERGAGFFKGELHTHTRHSDGSHTVAELLHRARELGLDFLALTDHNTTSGSDELFASSFPGILGAELTTFRGHHVCLGLDEMVPWHKEGRVLDVNEVVRAVKGKGALFTLTHPFNLGDPICTGCRWMTPELDPSSVDLVEIWHRRWTGDVADNEAAYRLWNDLWRRGHKPTGVGVRDWHNKQHEALLPGGLPTTMVKSTSLRQADLLDALRRGAAVVSRGPVLDPRVIVGGAAYGLGETGAQSSSPAVIEVDVDASMMDPAAIAGARVDVWRDGELLVSRDLPAVSTTLRFDDGRGGAGYWRVELRDHLGAPMAISNHIALR